MTIETINNQTLTDLIYETLEDYETDESQPKTTTAHIPTDDLS